MPTPRGPDSDRRSEERKKAEQIYLESKGNIKLVEIASSLGLPDNKIRKWKSIDNGKASCTPTRIKAVKKNRWSVPLRARGAFHLKREVLR